jgi:hypothetical protein
MYTIPHTISTTLKHRRIPHLTTCSTRNPILRQQRRKVRIRPSRKVMREVIVHIMHRNTRSVGAGARRLRSRTCETEALLVLGIDARGPGAASPGGAASAFGGELPVRAVRFVAFGEEGVGGACVGRWGGVAAGSFVSSKSSLLHVGFGLRRPARRDGGFLPIGVGDCKRVADHATSPCEASPADGTWSNDLNNDIIRLTCGYIGRRSNSVNDVGRECCCCSGLGECEPSLLIHVRGGACPQRQRVWRWSAGR